MTTKIKVPGYNFVIEKNVPIVLKEGHGPVRKYPYKEMEVGDSFYVPNRKTLSPPTAFIRATGRKFASRREGTGCRLYRIA